MKNLLVAAVLIITLTSSSSVFVHFSLNLMQPSSAEKLNSRFMKWEKTFMEDYIRYKQNGLDYLKKSLEMVDDTRTTDPVFVKQCSRTCPLPQHRGQSFSKRRINLEKKD